MYATGAVESGNLYINPEDGQYKYDMQIKDGNWLKNSIQNRMNGLAKGEQDVKRLDNGLYSYKIGSKDNVLKMKELKDNPNLIREMSNEQQNEWLNGYLDSKLTVDLKGTSESTSRLVDKDPEKLKLARDLLKQKGINAKLVPESEKLGPHLELKGLENHQNLQDNLDLENPTVNERLVKLLQHPERFEKKDEKERQRLGREFEKPLGKALEKIYPNSKIETKPKLIPGDKNSPIPDFRITHPDGSTEIVEAKLGYDDIKPKDHKYGKYADKVSHYYLEGEEKLPDTKFDTPNEYNNKDDLMRKLGEAKEEAKDNETKEEIDNIVDEINKIAADAKKAEQGKKAEETKDAKEERKGDRKSNPFNNPDIKTTDNINELKNESAKSDDN